ncbi:PP2C family protein-serine/threonine phosphatase [Streptomyces sp. NBC_01465]|uniref:PP2C family protein-serine/threonine phosphatase n=1 Tax=Streptomyces sp. NBC_01465 TaxID=2903878 RepID=UPI002E30024D|nr:PP2C family protein-serine/threonine phosphatase [Streptomyces sp. NBC_01465]
MSRTHQQPAPDSDQAQQDSSRALSWVALLLSTPEAAVFVDAGNRIVSLSQPAAVLLPELRAGDPLDPDALPGWLVCRDVQLHGYSGRPTAAVHTAVAPDRSTPPTQDIHPDDGHRTSRPQSLWGPGVSWEQCTLAVAHRLVDRWADSAAVVTPIRRGSAEVARATRPDGALRCLSERYERVRIEGDAVPGLADALDGVPAPEPYWQPAPPELPLWLTGPDAAGFDSLLVVPLPGDGTAPGALVLLRRGQGVQEPVAEGGTLQTFARQAAIALHAAGLQRIVDGVAEGLAEQLRPPPAARFKGADVAGAWRPSHTGLGAGGDFYDFLPRGNPSTVVLGDICGNNTRSALRASAMREQLAALAGHDTSHRELLGRLDALQHHDDDCAFASLVLATVSSGVRGGLALRISTAGHPPALILRRGGKVASVASGGSLIGVAPRVSGRSRLVRLRPGETCLLYSDGLTEARGGPHAELLGEDRFSEALATCYGLPPEAVVERMLMTTAQWLDGRDHDDITLVAIQAPPLPGGLTHTRTSRRRGSP